MARRFFQHLYMLRIPLLTLFLFGVILPETFSSTLFRGLADLELNQILVVSLGAFLLFSSAMTCAFLVLLYGAERADGAPLGSIGESLDSDGGQIPGWTVASMYAVGTLAYVRFLYVVYQTMKEVRVNPQTISDLFWYRAALGAIVGATVVIAVFFIDIWISSPRQAPEIEVFAFPIAYIFRNSSVARRLLKSVSDSQPLKIPLSPWKHVSPFLAKKLGPGYQYFDGDRQLQLGPGHGFAGILATACFLIYLMAGAGGHERLYSDGPFGPARPYEAVLLQVILLLLLACWLLSGLSFYFDRFRVPVLLPLGLVLFVTSHLGTSDHAYHTSARNMDIEASLPKPQYSFTAAPDHVIAIAAAGGGIQAAAWTGQVLCGLRQEPEIGSEFQKSVLVISGVSGGSVGTMFYLRCLEPSGGAATNPREAVMNSSLEGIAWGLAHPDLVHAVLPLRNFWWPGDDRGWALERSLRKNAQFNPPDCLLASPKSVKQWPVLLFNSTELRTGDPMVFSNSDFPSIPKHGEDTHRVHSFHQMYPGRDVLLETAVRMSAAFPFVSPAARADSPWNAEHLGDGGYFENAGIFALGEWLKEAANLNSPGHNGCVDLHHPPKKLLLIRIDAFPESPWDGEPGDEPKRWAFQLIAPALGVLHIRSEAPQVRGTAESADLLQLLGNHGYEATTLTARYSPSDATAAPGTPSVTCPKEPPLTWRLTEVDKLCIQRDWSQVKPKLVATIREFLASPAKAPTCTLPGEVRNEPLGQGMYLQELKH
jgi:hypothetical protein